MTKKPLQHYQSLNYPIRIVADEENGGYEACIPDLPGCFAWGKTKEEALDAIEDTRLAWLEAYYEDYGEAPEPRRESDFSGKFLLRLPKHLHEQLHHGAKSEGVSLNQYVVSLVAERNAYHRIAALFEGSEQQPHTPQAKLAGRGTP